MELIILKQMLRRRMLLTSIEEVSGKYMIACGGNNSNFGYAYTSNDFGASWIQRTTMLLRWTGAALSLDGRYQYACGSGDSYGLYRSSDFGANWSPLNTGANSFNNVSISSTGQYVLALTTSNYYVISTDYGANFTVVNAYEWLWGGRGVMDDTGQYQFITASVPYKSIDYGSTWAWFDTSNLGNARQIFCSATAQYAVVHLSGIVSVSSNYLVTFAQKLSMSNGTGVCMDSTGKYMIASDYSGYLYRTENYGENWNTVDSIRNWGAVGISRSGKYAIAGVHNGYVYKSIDYGSTWAQSASITGIWGVLAAN